MINTIALKQKQHEVKNDEFNKQTQEVKSMKKKVLVEREELEVQKKSFKKKEEEFEALMKTMRDEKEQVRQIKAEMEREREAMLNESIRMEGERSELKMREDQVKKRMESIESVREKLEWLNGRMREDIKHKMDNLQQNSDAALQLHTVLEQKLATLNDQKNTVACYMEMVEKQQDSMKSLLSELTTQREEMENEWEQQLEDEKQHLMKLKAELKEEREDLKKVSEVLKKDKVDLELMRSEILKQSQILEQEKQDVKDEKDMLEMTMAELQEKTENADNLFDEIKREKTKMSDLKLQLQTNQKRLEEMMNTIALKQKQHEVKNDEFNKQTQEVKSMKKKVLVEREELEVQKKSFKKKEEEFEAFMKTMREEKEQVSQTKAEMEREREAMLNESIRMEGERSELKMRDDQVKKRMESIESVREKLEWLNGRMREDIKHKMDNLQQNSDAALQLHTVLEQKLATLNDQKNTVACYTEMVEKQQDSMKSLLSELTSQREEMENEWEQQLEDEKQHLMKLKAELKEEREDLKKVSEVLNKDKVDLELMRSEILKQSQILEQEKQDVKDEKDMLEMTMAELQEKTENADNLFDEIKREKTKMSDLKLQLQTNQKRLEEMMNMIALKQKQHEVKNDEFNKQTQEVKSMKKKVLAEREELEVQKKSFTLDTWEITMTELPAPIESNYLADITPTNKKSCRITKCIESETNFSLNEPEEIKEKVSEIIITQDQFGIVLNAIVRFRRILELFNQKTYQVSCLNINRFEHKNRTILKLLTTLGHTCAEIDQLINLISFCYCQIQCKKAHLLKGKLHKSVQTEAAVQEFLHEHDVERKDFTEFQESQYMKDVQQSSCMNQTDKWEHQQKCDRGQGNLQGTAVSMKPEREGLLIRAEGKEVINVEMKKLAKVSELSAAIDDFTEQQMSNRECLRKIWKGTRVEQKEISQMKCGAHDMRNNLEKRLKVISHLVKKTLSQKGKTTKKTKLENDQSKDTFSQNDWNGDHKSLNEKYLELQQFKMSMFSQFEKLHNREKVTLTTSNKTNQKNQIDIFTGHPPDQVLQQASTKINQEQINAGEPEEAPETSNGFLCQLRHYCYRCCCCAHCKQVFPKVK
ncbi:trichohyalin-like isoform X4 [Acanthochromis polyacanthus]|uniref:trichohyalin-like isoform X4 n=1 Tax=Acanthochromis polyacanthus TaxID=80966 RepID=UPI0022344765|nr:trichohyalin-like isoform X4 [Acanthochromis polyacanthus]